MKDAFFEKDFFTKIAEPRKKLVGYDKVLKERIKNKDLGPRSKKMLLESLDYESSGQVGYGFFNVPPLIEKGKNDRLYDVDGKEYIDMLCSVAVSSIGQCHPEVVKTIAEQSKNLIHNFDFPTPPRIELAKKLCSITPGKFDKKVRFSITGSDGTENAMHSARWYTGCQFIMSAFGGYHGTTSGTIGVTTKGGLHRYTYPMTFNNGIVYFQYAYCYRCPFAKEYPSCDMFCVDFIDKSILAGKETPLGDQKSHVSNVAALIVEPMQCSGGYIIPPDEFLQGLKRLSDKYEFLLIVDEIQAGLGRTGKLWATEHSGVEPDILVMGKGISGGLPFGAMVARKEILSNWAPTAHVSTFAGYALGSAVGLKVFEIIEKEKLLERSNQMGKYFYDKLLELKEKYPIIGDVTGGKGLFLAIELVKDRKTKEPAIDETGFIREKCYDKGLLFQSGGYLYNRIMFIPALTVTKDSIDKTIKILSWAIEETGKNF